MEEGLEWFLETIDRASALWQSIDIRVLALNINGLWHNLLTTCYLDARPPDEIPQHIHLPITKQLAAWQLALPANELCQLVKSVDRGKVDLVNVTVHFTKKHAEDSSPYGSWNYYFENISGKQRGQSLPWSTHTLVASGDSTDTLIRSATMSKPELDNLLRTLDHPVDGIGEIADFILREREALRSGHNSLFKAFAPLEARLRSDKCHFNKGHLSFLVEASSKAVIERSSLGFVSKAGGIDFVSSTISLKDCKWELHNQTYRYSGQYGIETGHELTLLLRVSGWSVQQLKLIDYAAIQEAPKVLGYRVFDPGFKVLEDCLIQEETADSAAFERGAGWLLSLLGYQVDVLSGDRRLGEAVDILAYALPNPIVLATECTVSSIGSGGKLGKLVARARHLESSLESYEVIPVIITALSRHRLSEAELKEAAEDGIAVLAQEDLLSLFESLFESPSLSRATSFIRSKVPKDNWLGR